MAHLPVSGMVKCCEKLIRMNKRIGLLLVLAITIGTVKAQTPEEVLTQQFENALKNLLATSEGIVGLQIIDLNGNRTFSHNPEMLFPQASAIKIPILMEVYRQVSQGKLKIDRKIKLERSKIVGGSGILQEFASEPEISVEELAKLMIKYSDNTATNLLIDLVGMDNVNRMMRELGLEKTILQRKMMDTKASQEGRENLATPQEAARIMQMLHKGEFVNKQVSEQVLQVLATTNKAPGLFISGLPAGVRSYFKPGEIPGVRTEWVLVQLPERPFAVAVMESYGKREGETDPLFSRLAALVYDYFWKMGNASQYGTYFK
jgi:beta-lactamase class A